MKLVAYLRVSTDDKNQDPERQRPVLEAKAKAAGHTIVGWVIDEGTSAGENAMPTFDRPKVREAIRLAKLMGAEGLMAESVDRWTRKGADDLGYSMFVLKRDHGLTGQLLFADMPDDPFAREVLPPLMAVLARLDNKRRSNQAKSSAARKKALGIRLGRPPKPNLDDPSMHDERCPPGCSEIQMVHDMQAAGKGMRAIAVALSQHRRAHEVSDKKARNWRTITGAWLQTELFTRTEIHGLLVRVPRPSNLRAHRNEPNPMQSVLEVSA